MKLTYQGSRKGGVQENFKVSNSNPCFLLKWSVYKTPQSHCGCPYTFLLVWNKFWWGFLEREKEWKRGDTGLREQRLRNFSTASNHQLLSLCGGSCLVTLRQMQIHCGYIETRASRRWGPTDVSWSLLNNTEKATAIMLFYRWVNWGIRRSSSCSGTVHTMRELECKPNSTKSKPRLYADIYGTK